MGERYAPEGKVWVCLACGKVAPHDLYNSDNLATRGWDESCILNAGLFDKNELTFSENGRVTRIGKP